MERLSGGAIAVSGHTLAARYLARAQILKLQQALIENLRAQGQEVTVGNTDAVCPLVHHFAPGLYAREIHIPAGVVIVGKIHRHAHVNTISQGRVVVVTESGREELAAPRTWVSEPGTKRAVLALEDTIWTTYHPTHETDLARIEEHVIAPSYEAFDLERISS